MELFGYQKCIIFYVLVLSCIVVGMDKKPAEESEEIVDLFFPKFQVKYDHWACVVNFSSSDDKKLRVKGYHKKTYFDTKTGKELSQTTIPATDEETTIVRSADGNKAAEYSTDYKRSLLYIYNPNNPDKYWSLKFDTVIFTADFSRNGELLATSCSDKSVHIFGIKEEHCKYIGKISMENNPYPFNLAKFSPNNDDLLVIKRFHEQELFIFSLKEKRVIQVLPSDCNTYAATFSPDGALFATGNGKDKKVCIYDPRKWVCVQKINHNRQVCSLAFSANNKMLAVGYLHGDVHVFEQSSNTLNPSTESDQNSSIVDNFDKFSFPFIYEIFLEKESS